MPDRTLLGGVGGATPISPWQLSGVSPPHTLEEDNATLQTARAAPPVLQFNASGRYIQGWAAPPKGQYEWFNRGGLFSAHVECQS